MFPLRRRRRKSAALDESGSITFSDAETGEAVYTMPAPFMTDLASGNRHAAAYELLAVDEESYLLIVSVDAELANEILTADDTAALGDNGGIELCAMVSASETVYDAAVYSYISPEEPGLPHLNHDVYITSGSKGYALFDMPNIPEHASIQGALLSMTHSSADTCILSLYKCNHAWYNATWTYYAAQSRGDWGISFSNPIQCIVSTNGYATADISNYVLDWIRGAANYGFGIVPEESYPQSLFYMYPDEAVLEISYSVFEGTFCIQNAKTKRFMERYTEYTPHGPILREFWGDTTQVWQVMYLHNGFYKIASTKGGNTLWLTANDDSNAVATLVVAGSFPNENQQWKIETVDGGYVFCARNSCSDSDVNYTLCLGDTGNTKATMCANDGSLNTVWHLYAAPVTLQHWNANYPEDPTDHVCYWETDIKLYTEVESHTNDFYFEEGINAAFEQWNTILSVQVTRVNNKLDSNVQCYGGSREYLTERGLTLDSNIPGKTIQYYPSSAAPRKTLKYEGVNKKVYKMSGAAIYIANDGWGLTDQKCIIVHEYGHALGYIGHSSNSNDVMYWWGQGRYSLTSNDIMHMRQIYDIFRLRSEDEE